MPFVLDVSPKKIGETIYGVTVISPEALPSASQKAPLLLGAVGAAGARKQIRDFLETKGYDVDSDILFVA